MSPTPAPMPIIMFVPVETPNITNKREHWRDRARRAALHRDMTRAVWAQTVPTLKRTVIDFPIECILTRVSARELDDDNLRSALKSVRDGLAELFGVDDRDPRVRWHYDQEKKQPKSTTGVRVTIGEVPAVCPTCGRKRDAA